MTTDVSVYKFNHTMFRIKDPKVSIPFYEKVLGMEVSLFSSSLFPAPRRRPLLSHAAIIGSPKAEGMLTLG